MADGGIEEIRLGHPLLDDYLAFVAARARTNTWLAVASDLKIFFEVVARATCGSQRLAPAVGLVTVRPAAEPSGAQPPARRRT
jgi:hypothetical protein